HYGESQGRSFAGSTLMRCLVASHPCRGGPARPATSTPPACRQRPAPQHLAASRNTSRHNYKRDRNVANFAAPNVHNCSLQVVRNAAKDPLKYLMKYFGIKATEERLGEVEALGEDIAKLENAIENLKEREASIASSINPPPFILKYFKAEFMEQVGVHLSPVAVPYPIYSFEYVSAGGNSSQETTITLDTPTIDA